MKNDLKKISWQSLERHDHTIKNSDWFWALGIISAGAIILAFYFGDVLFGIILTLFAITAGMLVNKKPEVHQFEISRKGVQIGTLLYPYSNLESFWVEDSGYEDKIILRSRQVGQPIFSIPFDSTEIDAEMIRDYLLDYLDEEELEEPLHQEFMKFLGF